MSDIIEAWHFLPDNGRLRYDDNRKPRIGAIYRAKGELIPCENGMHGSKQILDALKYAPGSLLCRVEMIGPHKHQEDKICSRGRRILWKIDATTILHEFACRCAARALKKAGVQDPRCWKAIRVKRDWLKGQASNDELAAARDAAWDAAWDAWAAAVAESSAAVLALVAALAADVAAAVAAAWDAARDAESRWQEKTILRMIERERRQA